MNISEKNSLISLIRCRHSSQKRIDPGVQFGQVKRLGDVVIGAAQKPLFDMVLGPLCRQVDDGYLHPLVAQQGDKLASLDIGEVPVHDNKVDLLFGDRLADIFGTEKAQCLVTLFVQPVFEYLKQIFFIFYDQYLCSNYPSICFDDGTLESFYNTEVTGFGSVVTKLLLGWDADNVRFVNAAVFFEPRIRQLTLIGQSVIEWVFRCNQNVTQLLHSCVITVVLM